MAIIHGLCQGFPTSLRPTGRMRPPRQYCAAREVIYVLIVLAELMKYWNQNYDFRLNYSTVVPNIMGLINKILRKIYQTSLILLHAARLQSWLTGVRPVIFFSVYPFLDLEFFTYFYISLWKFIKIYYFFKWGCEENRTPDQFNHKSNYRTTRPAKDELPDLRF